EDGEIRPLKLGGTAGKGVASFGPVTGNHFGQRFVDTFSNRIRLGSFLIIRFNPATFQNSRQLLYRGGAFGGGKACLQSELLRNHPVGRKLVGGLGEIQRRPCRDGEIIAMQAAVCGLKLWVLGVLRAFVVSRGALRWAL